MKEIRTIKMVEQTEVKFVADDGKEFIGEHAERDCRDYERTKDKKRVDFVELKMPFIDWFHDEQGFYKTLLNSKSDFVAMMDYFNVVWDVYGNDIEEPATYPYTMIVSYSCGYVNEYTGNLKEELQKTLEQLGKGDEHSETSM